MGTKKSVPENVGFISVYNAEIEAIKKRRRALNSKEADLEGRTETPRGQITTRALEPNIPEKSPLPMFGIALSGGGIRSATINLGFLKVLNENNVFRLADYLSTVSGGGFTGSYITEKLRLQLGKDPGPKGTNPYEGLFSSDDIAHIKRHGFYLAPGKKGLQKLMDYTVLIGGFIATALLHLIWYVMAFILILYLFKVIYLSIGNRFFNNLGIVAMAVFGISACWYYFCHGLRFCGRRFLWPVKGLITALALSLAAIFLVYFIDQTGSLPQLVYPAPFDDFVFLLAAVFIIGIFANPNILSPSQIYRFRLEEAFRWFGKKSRKLCDIGPDCGEKGWGPAPYPLINTTLNLSGAAQPEPSKTKSGNFGKSPDKLPYSGFKTCDYFLLSPFYCGSKLTGFLPTANSEYRLMSLSTAVTISGAALNPEMGYRSNKITAFFMTLLNLRLGYWALNPYLFKRCWNIGEQIAYCLSKCLKNMGIKYFWPTYWPVYNIYELLNKSNIYRWRVNLSDGGHIENLAVFELLRRKLPLIVGVDAGADPDYTFSDLKNLVARARNELGIEIKFRQDPETIIRPRATSGFSQRQFCIADLYDLPRIKNGCKKHIGIFVYVKASITAQEIKDPQRKQKSYTYRLYHPKFPHEPTSDQFFDDAQWEAYFETGKEMAMAFLEECRKADPAKPPKFPQDITLDRFSKMVSAIN